MYFYEDESIKGMALTMKSICEKMPEELERKGALAAHFIRTEKNSKVQVNKILELLRSC